MPRFSALSLRTGNVPQALLSSLFRAPAGSGLPGRLRAKPQNQLWDLPGAGLDILQKSSTFLCGYAIEQIWHAIR